jgi:hypothetical protein
MFKSKANFQHCEQLLFNHIRKTHLGRQAATTETDTTITTIIIITIIQDSESSLPSTMGVHIVGNPLF